MQINATLKYHFTLFSIVIINKTNEQMTTNAGEYI